MTDLVAPKAYHKTLRLILIIRTTTAYINLLQIAGINYRNYRANLHSTVKSFSNHRCKVRQRDNTNKNRCLSRNCFR